MLGCWRGGGGGGIISRKEVEFRLCVWARSCVECFLTLIFKGKCVIGWFSGHLKNYHSL